MSGKLNNKAAKVDEAAELDLETDAAFDEFLRTDPEVQSVLKEKAESELARRIWDEICKETAEGGPRTSVEIIDEALAAAGDRGSAEWRPHNFVGIGAGELGMTPCEECGEPERSPIHAAKFVKQPFPA